VIDGQTGFLVDKDDPEALAVAMSRLLGDGELRATMGERGSPACTRLAHLETTPPGAPLELYDIARKGRREPPRRPVTEI